MIRLTLLFLLFTFPAYACEVDAYFSPGSAYDSIVKEIRGAKKSIHVTAYQFTDQSIALELEAAKLRGVEVKAVIDGNQQLKQNFQQLGALGFPVRFNNRYAILHSKVILLDGTVITGSYNWTNSARKRNAENIVIIKDCPQVLADYKSNFQRLWREAK